jgi:Ca-activated chloride channel homolog
MTNGKQTYQRLLRIVLAAEVVWWILVLLAFFLLDLEAGKVRLLHKNYLWFWLLIPAFLFASWFHWKWKSKLYDAYAGIGRTRMLWVTFEPLKAFLHYFLLRLVIFFTVLGMAQPVMGSKKVKGSKKVLDLVICLDVSNSMNVQDMSGKVSRLKAGKNAIIQLLNQLKGERIAVIIFANDAFTQLPLTMDYGAAKLFIPDVESSMISDQGTNIGNALKEAQEQFKDEESGRAILVITDGEDHEQLWRDQLNELQKKNVLLAYLGLGTKTGGLIPNDPYDPALGFKRENGKPVVSKLDVGGLKNMASSSNSQLIVSSSAFPDVTTLAQSFSNAKNKSVKSMEFKVDKNFYQLPVLVAIACFIAYLFLPFIVNRKHS